MTSPGLKGGRRINARSSSSNHPPDSPFLEYEEDDRSLVYSLRSDGDNQSMVLLNLRKSMAEQVRQKLKEKIATSFEGFLDILNISQDDNGKVSSLECDLKSGTCHKQRVIISCEGDDSFLVYQDVTTEGIKLQEFDSWIEHVSNFGLSGRCNSLSSLFQFGYEQWRRLLIAPPVVLESREPEPLSKAKEDLDHGRPHSAIDTLSEIIRIHSSEYNEALTLRSKAYAQAGMYSLCIADSGQIEHVTPDVLYWKGVSLMALQRTQEAVHCFVNALDADPTFLAAQEKLDDILNQTGQHYLTDNPSVTPRASRNEHHSRRHSRRERINSVPESGTTGTTASRWSSRSTTPTSCASDDIGLL